MSKIRLNDVTLVSVAATKLDDVVSALVHSQTGLEFYDTKLISPSRPSHLPSTVKWVQSPPLPLRSPGKDAYSHFMIFDLWEFIASRHCLVIHADGYVINPKRWSSTFLDYDYIGAPWPIRQDAFIDPFGKNQRVGNGGFSLRSQKLLRVPLQVTVPFEVNDDDFYFHANANLLHEDGNICVHNRHIYEQAGCKFAPIDVAVKFAQEQFVKEARWITPFGFHGRKPKIWRSLFPERRL